MVAAPWVQPIWALKRPPSRCTSLPARAAKREATSTALVTMVRPLRVASASATRFMVLPASMKMVWPLSTRLATFFAMARFSRTRVAWRTSIGGSSPVSTAPPCTRRISPRSASSTRSRRMVSRETPSSVTIRSTDTWPLVRSRSRIRECRSSCHMASVLEYVEEEAHRAQRKGAGKHDAHRIGGGLREEAVFVEAHHGDRREAEVRRDQEDHAGQGHQGAHEQIKEGGNRGGRGERQHGIADHMSRAATGYGHRIVQCLRHLAHAGLHREERLRVIVEQAASRDDRHASVQPARESAMVEGEHVAEAEHHAGHRGRQRSEELDGLRDESG